MRPNTSQLDGIVSDKVQPILSHKGSLQMGHQSFSLIYLVIFDDLISACRWLTLN